MTTRRFRLVVDRLTGLRSGFRFHHGPGGWCGFLSLILRPIGEVKFRTMSDRTENRKIFSTVSLEIQGRSGRFDVIELPDTLPNIVGQIPLEDLDWVVDCRNQKLIPNPEHKHGELCDDF